MAYIKIIMLLLTLLFLVLYPILQKIKTNKMLRDIEGRDAARRITQELRERQERARNIENELQRRRNIFMREHGINPMYTSQSPASNIRRRQERERQEEFLTQEDFEL